MEIEIPDFLTKEFIQQALESNEEISGGDTIHVEEILVEKPIAKGDNYVCEIFRVTADYKRTSDENNDLSKISLIVKTPIKGGMYDMLMNMGVVQKEVRIYNEYLPKLNEVLGEHKLTANAFKSTEENVLILEDLKFKGFVMADRREQLDYEHCVMALKTLAKFHAASVKLHEIDPELVESVGKEVFFNEEIKLTNQEFAKLNFRLLAEECKVTPELNHYSEQLLGYAENSWDILVELVRPKDTKLNVLNHGDFWVNNMLFKYDAGEPVDLKIIDLQISRYTTPAIDLLYFFNGSVREDIRTGRYNDLLNVYVNELNMHLENFGSTEKLSESDLKTTMDECDFFGMLVSLSLFPIIIGNPEDGVLNMKEVTEDDFKSVENNPLKCYYKNKQYKKIIKERLSELEKKGWF